MATTYWTLTNSDSVEKSLEDWGIDDLTAVFTSQAEDVVTLSAAGRRFDAAYLFTYKTTVIVKRDRVRGTDGSYSGGSIYFAGIVAHPHVSGSGAREFQSCSLIGPWWYLQERGFEQEYRQIASITLGVPTFVTPNPTTSRIFLNLELGEFGVVTPVKLTTGEQLEEALTWCLKPFVDTATAPPFQVGTVALDVDPPVDEVKNITCAEAVRKMLRWSPDAVAWFDYSTSPPTFHAKRRADLTAHNLNITTTKPTSISVTPRFDLQRPYVRIQYERTNNIGGTPVMEFIEEVYPDPIPSGAINQFGGVPFVIDLRGYTTSFGTSITTRLIEEDDEDWWLANLPEYQRGLTAEGGNPARITSVVFDFDTAEIAVDGDEAFVALANQLVAGSPSGNISASWQRQKATIEGKVTYRNGTITNKIFSFSFTATNASTGTYGGGVVDAGDPLPVGLAEDFYNAVGPLAYQGSLSFREAELGGLPKLGEKLNLLGSDNAAWETMVALVQRVTENVQRRTTVVEFGPPPHLDLADMIGLLRVTRNRDPKNPYTMRTGTATSSGGSLLAQSARANTGVVGSNFEHVACVKDEPAESETAETRLELDAANHQITARLVDGETDPVPAWGSITLKLGEDPGTVPANPGHTMGKEIKLRETVGCDNEGNPVYCLMPRSEWYSTPLTSNPTV
jgi:hypothetical protein